LQRSVGEVPGNHRQLGAADPGAESRRRLTGFPVAKAPEPDWEANQQLANEIGYRSVALFKDDTGLLPLSQDFQRILVIAPRADWDMYPALKTALEGAGHTVEFADYPPPWEGPVQDPEALDALPLKAQQADLVLLFTWQVHLNRLLNGDTWQIDLVQRLIDTGRPLVVIAIKSPTDLLSLPPVTTYLAMYGSRQGQIQAVIDALTGSFILTGQNPLPGLRSP
jgi:beta-N-acetylhexosaminidase